MSTDIIARDEAKSKQSSTYYTGKPCKHGHTSPRYTSNKICVECQSRSNKTHWDNNTERLIEEHKSRLMQNRDAYNANRKLKYHTDNEYRAKKIQGVQRWYADNRNSILNDERRKQKARQYQQRNTGRLKESHRAWRHANAQHVNEQSSLYRKQNRSYYNAKQATYRAHKLLATPGWCEHSDIKQMYDLSRELSAQTGTPHHVDHIVPLVNNLVCGLHCIANLQIISEHENKSKSNKFDIA